MIDLDAVATTRPAEEVTEAMLPWIGSRQANPGSVHRRGADAASAIEGARAEVAALLGAEPDEVVFTSGVTEANNFAVRGLARLQGGVAVVPAHEHPSLLHPALSLSREGLRVVTVQTGRDGLVPPRRLPQGPIGFLALSHAHAELGALQPIGALVTAVRMRGGLVHVDATLTAGRIPVRFELLGHPDLLAVSFHHFGGPMGVGALVIRRGLFLPPLLQGGVQERGFRPGSPNLAGIVGAGVAARLAREGVEARRAALDRCSRALAALLTLPGIERTGPPLRHRLPGHVSISVRDVDGEAVLLALEEEGILAATGSACADAAGLPSAALRAAGHAEDEIRGAIVLCASPVEPLDPAQAEHVVRTLGRRAEALRRLAGR